MKRPFILQGAVLLCLLLGHISAESNTEACKGYDCLEDAVCPPDSSIDDDYYDDNIVFDDLIEDIKDSERHIPPRFQRSITNLFAKCCSIDKVCKCNANACKLPVCTNSTHIPIRTRIASHSPGDCCDEYKCQPEPKCSEDSTDEWHTECKECKCIFGQVMCALIENCEVQPEGCYSQDLKKTFHHEEQWKEMNDCMECECSDGETKCIQIDCKVPDCENPIKIPGQCCRVCPVIQPSSTTESQEIPPIQNATTEGPTGCLSSTLHKFFKHGEEWKEAEDCMDCSCNDGDIRCTSTFCKPLDCEVSVKVPGQCCKVCVEPAPTTSTTTTTTTASTTTMEPEEDNLLLPRDFFNPFTYGIALVLILLATIPFLVWYYCYRQHHQSCHLVATTMDNKYSSIEQSESTVTTAPSTPTMR